MVNPGIFWQNYVAFEVETKAKAWSVWRKEKDFFALRTVLSRLYPGCIVTRLPSKFLTKFDKQSLEKRKRSLQHFLDETLAHPLLSTSEILADFLSSSEKDFKQQLAAAEASSPPKSVSECFSVSGSASVSYNHVLAEYCVKLNENSLVLKDKFSE
eukprot:TRINITY_DN10348_c0_g1_i6.p1 TRINITY_DN10348_c0_g1~~TRINITY_DN10348_c0_g1_i6.p1  ORF type:complete len:156 (-),score=42.01 TRINITY_DN10348_c0_g1_i6:296-763(-)